MATKGKLPHPNRYITTHDENGKSIVEQTIEARAPFYELAGGDVGFAQLYVTDQFPAKLEKDADLQVYQDFLKQPPGLTVSGGTVIRYVDVPPEHLSPMHRTISIDYGVVLEGEVDLVLDSGERRHMVRGDVCVQRGTMHAWQNTSTTEFARMLFILQPTQPFSIGNEEAKEDLADMKGVRASS